MFHLKETDTFLAWRARLKDERAKGAIAARLTRLAYGHMGDAKPVGDGVSELRIHGGPGYRIYFLKRGNTIIVLLCAAVARARRPETFVRQSGWHRNRTTDMAKLTTFDPAEMLTSGEAISVFMSDAFATEDAGYIAHALGVVARAKGMTQIAKDTGLSREQLYRSFSKSGNPTLKTTIAVMKALGVELRAQPLSR